MFSLAPIFYRNVFVDDGGPVERITVGKFPVLGRDSYQANALLKCNLTIGKPKSTVYGTDDGTGSADNPVVARHMAISEALERWAYLATYRSGDAERYGFHLDRSSNGMAAFPGFPGQAKRRSLFEALERFSLVSWWAGHIKGRDEPTQWPDVHAVRLEHGLAFGEVALLYRKSAVGIVAYGHAAASTFKKAVNRATVELCRNEYVLAVHRARGATTNVTDSLEKRCLYYSTQEGHAEFLEHVSAEPSKPRPRWRPVFDGEIRGPWSKWTTVWRCSVELPDYSFLNSRERVFFW